VTQNSITTQPHTKPGKGLTSTQHTERLVVRSWGQVDSVLREMAELQVAINEEIDLFNSRVDRAKERMYETGSSQWIQRHRLSYRQELAKAAELLREGTERLRARQVYWETMLKKFMLLSYEKYVVTDKYFRFGSIHCHGGKIDILLDVDYAKAMLGRP